MSKFDFPSNPYPKQIWPEQKIGNKPQYIWSGENRAWFKYNVEQYSITPSFLRNVNEGESIDFLIQTTGVTDGTIINWSIDHISTEPSDFLNEITVGAIAINNNQAALTLNISNTDGDSEDFEEFRVILNRFNDGIEVAQSPIISIRNVAAIDPRVYSILPSSNVIIEGGNITFYIFTQNVEPDLGDNFKSLEWEITGTGITAEDLGLQQLTGTLELNGSGNGRVTFITSNEMIPDGSEDIINMTFNIKDDVEGSLAVVAKSTIVIQDLIAEDPPEIDSLTVSPTTIESSGNAVISWTGSNLSSNDIIKMFDNNDTNRLTPIRSLNTPGSDSGQITFTGLTPPPSNKAIFGYYALVGDPLEEKLLKTSGILTINSIPAPPPPTPSPSPPTPSPQIPARWILESKIFGTNTIVDITGDSGRTFDITGFSGFWAYTYTIRHIDGPPVTITINSYSSDSRVNLVVNNTTSQSYTLSSGSTQNFNIVATTGFVSPSPGETISTRFSLSASSSTTNIPSYLIYYINFRHI